jgi:hypothetical protein
MTARRHCRGCGCTSRQLINVPQVRPPAASGKKPVMIVRLAKLELHSWPRRRVADLSGVRCRLERLRRRSVERDGMWSWS